MRLLALVLTLVLPKHGALVAGKSLGGVGLGMTHAQVRVLWGTGFGRCRGCAQETWYFNYRPFEPEGAAVRFRDGRVDAVWTLWQPLGWHVGALRLGAPSARVTQRYGALLAVPCGSYSALVLSARGVTTALYIYEQRLWGFELSRSDRSPCH